MAKRNKKQFEDELKRLLKDLDLHNKAQDRKDEICDQFKMGSKKLFEELDENVDGLSIAFFNNCTMCAVSNASLPDDESYVRARAIIELLRSFLMYELADDYKKIFGETYGEASKKDDFEDGPSLIFALVSILKHIEDIAEGED